MKRGRKRAENEFLNFCTFRFKTFSRVRPGGKKLGNHFGENIFKPGFSKFKRSYENIKKLAGEIFWKTLEIHRRAYEIFFSLLDPLPKILVFFSI